MERFLLRKIRIAIWALGLVVLVLLVGLVGFGAMVRSEAMGATKYGLAGRVAYSLASFPSMVKEVTAQIGQSGVLPKMQPAADQRLAGPRGWRLTEAFGRATPDGYLLFSRYEGDARRSVVELVDMRDFQTRFTFRADVDRYFDGLVLPSVNSDPGLLETANFRIVDPLLLPGGDFLVKNHASPLVRTDLCGNMKWIEDSAIYHHSLNLDSDGNIWVPSEIEPSSIAGLSDDFNENGIVQVSPEGRVLWRRSVLGLLSDFGMDWAIFPPFYERLDDTAHLNDIEPVLADGPFWKRGDIFASIRNIAAIALIRPSEDRIVWLKQGLGAAQHDVDILDDTRIAIFDNNMYSKQGVREVDTASDIVVYDFATDTATRPYRDVFRKNDIRTNTEGLFDVFEDGYLFVEETNAGRTMIFAPDGALVAEHVNTASDGTVYLTNWSRPISRALGDDLLAAAAAKPC